MLSRVLDLLRGRAEGQTSESLSLASVPCVPFSNEFTKALDWVMKECPDIVESEREAVLALAGRLDTCGPVLVFERPSAGFVAAIDGAVLQVLSSYPCLVTTRLVYTGIDRILFAPQLTPTECAIAFSGTENDENVAISALVDLDRVALAQQLVQYVSSATAIVVDVREHD